MFFALCYCSKYQVDKVLIRTTLMRRRVEKFSLERRAVLLLLINKLKNENVLGNDLHKEIGDGLVVHCRC